MSVSTYEKDNRLKVFRGVTYPAVPANHFISLHSGDPGLVGSNELSGSGYARVAIAPGTGTWTAPNGAGSRQIENAGAVTFPVATGSDWTAATYFGIWDASTAGNFIRGAGLTASKTVQVGDTPSFAAGVLIIYET